MARSPWQSRSWPHRHAGWVMAGVSAATAAHSIGGTVPAGAASRSPGTGSVRAPGCARTPGTPTGATAGYRCPSSSRNPSYAILGPLPRASYPSCKSPLDTHRVHKVKGLQRKLSGQSLYPGGLYIAFAFVLRSCHSRCYLPDLWRERTGEPSKVLPHVPPGCTPPNAEPRGRVPTEEGA